MRQVEPVEDADSSRSSVVPAGSAQGPVAPLSSGSTAQLWVRTLWDSLTERVEARSHWMFPDMLLFSLF